jgi:hypothetical protein
VIKRFLALALALAVWLALLTATADAGQPWVIPPGCEDDARRLLDDVPPGPVRFGGPRIDRDSIEFDLFDASDAVIAQVHLQPRDRARAAEPTSESFVIRISIVEGVDGEAVASLLAAAVASVQAHDDGGFYTKQALDGESEFASLGDAAPLDPRPNQRRWARDVGVLVLALGVGGGLLLRRRETEPS